MKLASDILPPFIGLNTYEPAAPAPNASTLHIGFSAVVELVYVRHMRIAAEFAILKELVRLVIALLLKYEPVVLSKGTMSVLSGRLLPVCDL